MTPGRRLLEVCTWFPLDFDSVPLSFGDFALYSFVVINHNYELTTG